MEMFFLLLLVPVVWALIAKRVLHETITWQEMGIQMAISCVLVAIVYAAGSYSKTADVEIWNGQITSKHRDHGHYLRSYSCHCYTSCTTVGKTQSCRQICQTCYEDRYTVNWYLKSTLGDIGLQSYDRTSRSVYNEPDPASYIAAYVGEPCSKEKGFTNYVKAVPESLFNSKEGALRLKKFESMIPAYPRVHSHYHVNRVISVGVKVPDLKDWTLKTAEHLRYLGPEKEANIIIVFANTTDQTYRYALEQAWLGGKQNDVIVVMGTPQYPKVAWADVITFGQNAGNGMLAVDIRDRIMKTGVADATATTGIVASSVNKHFKRKHMEDYEYLKDEIQPPTWVLILAFLLAIGSSIGLTYVFHRNY